MALEDKNRSGVCFLLFYDMAMRLGNASLSLQLA